MRAKLYRSTTNIAYHTNFKGSNGFYLVVGRKKYLFTDTRYTTQMKLQTKKGIETFDTNFDGLIELIKELKINKIEVESKTPFSFVNKIKDSVNGIEVLEFDETWDRRIKSNEELDLMRKAAKINDKVFKHLKSWIKPGMTEKEISTEILIKELEFGASGPSFMPIVASGPNGALPHARPSKRKIKNGELVIIDMGVVYEGYCSDMTRTFAIGEIDEELKVIYESVLRAQESTVKLVKPGVWTQDLDKNVIKYFKEDGFENYYIHSLGHGIGLDIHEMPSLSYKIKGVKIKENDVFTIEPGIYIPNKCGVRIEDTVIVTNDGVEVITQSPKKLITIK